MSKSSIRPQTIAKLSEIVIREIDRENADLREDNRKLALHTAAQATELADLRADRERAFRIGYQITNDCQTVEEMTSALVACIERVRTNKDKELADLRANLEAARKDAERWRYRINYEYETSCSSTAISRDEWIASMTAAIDAAIAEGKGEK